MPKLRRRSREPASTLRRRLVRRFRAARIESHAPQTANRRGLGRLAHDLVVAGYRCRAVQEPKSDDQRRHPYIANRLRRSIDAVDIAFVEDDERERIWAVVPIDLFEKLLREKLAWEGGLIPLPSEGDDEEEAPGEIDGVRLRILSG